MTAAFVVAPAAAADAGAIAAFNVALAAETEGLALDPAVVRAGVDALLADPAKGRYFLARPAGGGHGDGNDGGSGEICGQLMVTTEWSDWRNGEWWWVQSVFVAPGSRRRGAFGLLLDHAAAAADAAGAVGLRLYVERSNAAALRAYVARGFAETHYRLWERPSPGGAGGAVE